MGSPTKLIIVFLVGAGLVVTACGRTEPVESAEDTTTTETTRPPSSATTSTTAAEQPSTYVIQPGDSLGAIAAAYGLSTDDLANYNNLPDPDRIAAGQQLLIPPGATSTTTIPTTAPAPPPETETTGVTAVTETTAGETSGG